MLERLKNSLDNRTLVGLTFPERVEHLKASEYSVEPLASSGSESIDSILATSSHRIYPPPTRPWLMVQTWHELLFAHWDAKPDTVRDLLPKGLELDLFDGKAWVGVIPFRMSGIRFRHLPQVWGTSAFCELNVRTYVKHGEKSGVYFFSLDAANPLAVFFARRFFSLPYYEADMDLSHKDDGTIYYSSVRTHKGARSGEFLGGYAPSGKIERTLPGTLENFLTERYCLFTSDSKGQLWVGEIHHLPWPLQPAKAEIEWNTMAEASGIKLPKASPILHFSKSLRTLIWSLSPLEV